MRNLPMSPEPQPFVVEEAEPGSVTIARPGPGQSVLSGYARRVEGDLPDGTICVVIDRPKSDDDPPMYFFVILNDQPLGKERTS